MVDEVAASGQGWAMVLGWQAASARRVELLDCSRADGETTLLAAQVTTRSPMGAIALNCAGIVIDGGWLRVLGAGDGGLDGLREWNASLGGLPLTPPLTEALVVAYDALGGFFAINGGQWAAQMGGTYYLSPDGTGWQSLGMGYSGLVQWSMSDALDPFYEPYRWAGWEAEVAALGANEAMLIYPPLGFEMTPLVDRARRPVPARELWTFHHELATQTRALRPGANLQGRLRR